MKIARIDGTDEGNAYDRCCTKTFVAALIAQITIDSFGFKYEFDNS